ncbi:MAG TPA: AraC family transcriptional regulator [Thermodesulfobacteriota bacterium]
MYLRRVEPRAVDWRSFAWRTGIFDTGRRPYTDVVEGTIRTPDHLVLVTLRGGAARLEVDTDCDHTYAGPDYAGAVSFVPAHCERRLRLRGVRAEWASIALRPELVTAFGDGVDIAPFTNVDDPFIAGLVAEFARLHACDGRLDPTYCDAMSHALAAYLAGRYGRRTGSARRRRTWKLPPWRVRRIADYVEAHLGEEILVADLARLVGLSTGHLHRAFRETVGVTPLDYINERRVRRAIAILATERVTVADLALRVGFSSPSHFARTFRRVTGVTPSRYVRASAEPGG